MGIPVWISRGLTVPDLAKQLPENVVDLSQGQAANHQRQSAGQATIPTKAPSARSTGAHISSLTADLQDDGSSRSAGSVKGQAAAVGTPAKPAGPGLHAADDLIKDLQQNPASKIADIAASLDAELVTKAPVSRVPVADLQTLGWADLQQTVVACTACDLHSQRKQTVFGKGSTQAQWMIVGDIPRLEDEWQQQPFTGESGELLKAMLASIGVDSNLVYMTNLMKCRPPLDRSPDQEQAASCYSYLQRQAELLNPALIVLMGRDVVRQVLGNNQSMASLRQQVHNVEGLSAPVVATYHPSYLLKQPRLKAQVWQDLQLAKRAMQ